MRLQLGKPCKNCPFGVAATRIRFSCRERAEEIEEHAYRNGFPCHLSATLDEDDEDAGYEFGANTQHCAGAALMFLNEGYETWPGIDNRDLPQSWLEKLLPNLDTAIACAEDFYEANEASAIEARRAETHSGSVEDESAVAKPDAQGGAA
jgi:hypothetical protein